MALIDTSITINKPVETVYGFIASLDSYKTQAGIVGVTVTTPGPLGVGTKFRLTGEAMGRKYDIDNEIVAMEPNKKFGVKTFAAPPASPVTNTYTFEAAGPATKVTMVMDTVIMTGGIPGMEAMIIGPLKTSLDTALAGFKKIIGG
jgi:hypothetical protein